MSDSQLVGVYNANGGVMGELSYLKGKITGEAHCDLCDITHGLNPRGKASWRQKAQESPIPITTVHLNEMDSRTAAVMAHEDAPAIVLLDPEGDRVLINTAELAQCDKDPQRLLDLINRKLAPDAP
ncbi:hypothetical protein KRX51_08885 [Corynebacterium sp. TAE3-ERU12]|uniref:hypothetical protein n=1 Tax=Corynebacterium sp. TAE3-ERU12 TaxID=2849491 RepID=UPI001C479DB5|nr:hypothetical protein [Corynebacterium sp. TAE3-ERU12]MBV7296023.1 hypothetical protein [Corynebacterium sp. TAE3-ERU12]